MKKKLLVLLLVLAMVFSMALTASAVETEPALSLSVTTGKGAATVYVYLESCEGATNGTITVGYDAQALTLTEVTTSDAYAVDSINDLSAGSVTLAWVGGNFTAEKTLMLTLVLEIAEGCTDDLTYSVESNGIYGPEGAFDVASDIFTAVYNAPANTEALETAIAAARALDASAYSADSYADVEAALEQAVAVLANADATQEEVDAAAKALNDAMAGLRPAGSADATALKAAIAEAEKLNKDLYTQDSWAAMQAALAAAKQVLANLDATQEEVDAAAATLNQAIDDLVLTTPNVGSGDNSHIGLWMTLLVLSMAAVIAVTVAMIRSGKGKQVSRFLSIVLVAAMMMTLIPAGTMAIVVGEDGAVDNIQSSIQDILSDGYVVDGEDTSFIGSIKEVFNKVLNLQVDQNITSVESVYADDELVRVIVELTGECLLEQGYTMAQISAQDERVLADAAKLETVQDYVAAQINNIVKNSGLSALEVSVKYHYTTVLNGIALTVPYGTLNAIRQISGVKEVYLSGEYYAPEATETTNSPSMYATSDSFGSAQTWHDLGYTGTGMVIAVIDTGLDLDHPSFVDAPEGGALSVEDIAEVLTDLNAYSIYNANSVLGLTAQDLYRNGKVPFAFNYVDASLDATHDFDDQGDHGTHVSGIAAANRLDTTSVVGVAPDAQIVVMKVFGQSSSGASTDDIIAAIEDCFVLGVDVINMSLGAPAGFTEDSVLVEQVYGRVLESDMMLAVAAGNIPSTAVGNNQGSNLNYTSDPDMGIVNSPSTYLGATSVASSENHYVMMPYFSVGENKIPYVDVTYYDFAAIAGTYEYVVIPGVGDVSDYEGLDVAGRVVLVQRGVIDFPTKQKNAHDMGAIAMICYDNVEGALVSMYDGGYLPNVFICKADGEKMIAAAENGIGTLVIQPLGEETPIKNGNGGTMSDFSAWGVTADLQLAPDVTAPGGNIYSCYTDGNYGTMSGTSMACPHIAGMSALVLQYLHETQPDLEKADYHTIVEALVMCTAEPALDPNGIHYSPRTQGSGFANVYNAITSPVYLTSYQEATGELTPKASMGDDPERTGVFTFTFDMNNLTDSEQVYMLASVLMTDQYLTLEGFGDTEFFGEEERYLSGSVSFAFPNSEKLSGFDFDGNGTCDMNDVEYALDVVNGLLDDELSLDFNGDSVIDTRDVQYLYELVLGTIENQQCVTVPAGGSITVTVTIELSAEDMAYMDAHYENGTYVEGFIRAYAVTDGAVDLSLPFMGFYGDWTDAPIFDTGWYYEDPDEVEYNRYMHVIFATLGGSANYGGLGVNPYMDEVYDAEHNVLSPNGDGYYDYVPEIYISLMRSAELLDFTWTDDATGETLFYEYYPYARKGYYWSAYGMAMPIIYTDGGCMPYDFYDSNGNLMVSDLQHLTLTIRGYLDDGELDNVYINEYGVPVPDTSWADGVMEIPVVIDLSAPKINMDTLRYFTEDGRNYVTFEVEDNYDIAAIVATTMGGGAYEYIPVTTKTPGVDGEKATVTLDITDYDASFQIVLCDYGCNESYYELSNVNCDGLNEDEFYAFRRYSTVETSTTYYTTDQLNGWYSFVNSDSMLQHTSQPNSGEATVYAAEYVDGYIFGAQAGAYDYNTLFVTKAGSWDRIQLGGDREMNRTVYEWPGRDGSYFPLKMLALDMTYDYTTDTMYILANAQENATYFPDGEVNILLKMDLQTGAITILGKIFAENDESGSFLALTLACDENGVLYTINYDDGLLYTINTEPVEKTARYGYGTYMATCVDADGVANYYPAAYTQSMTFDHATGELCWAGYQGQIGQSAFIRMDKETGEIISMTYTVNNAEMVGLFKPWDSGSDVISDAVLEGISLRKDTMHLSVGQVAAIGVLPAPYNASLGTVTYRSLDPEVATVNAYGNVVAVGIGATVIEVTCTTDSGEIFVTHCSVNVAQVSGTLFAYSGDYWLLMDAGTPGAASQVVDAMELDGTVSAAAYRNGYLYVAALVESYDADYNTVYTTNLYQLDASTLQGELIGTYDGKTTALAFNYADGFLYGLNYHESFDARYNWTATFDLIRVNMSTGQTLTVTNLDTIYPCSDTSGKYLTCSGALAIDYEGNFYVNGDNASWEYNLVRFNLDENDQITNVVEFTGFTEYDFSGDAMVWSQRNGGLLHVANETLYWVDVSDMEDVEAISLGEVRGATGAVLALAIPVSNEPEVEGAVPTDMTLDASYRVAEGDSIRIVPTLNPWNAIGEFTYSIADETIAMVDEDGHVTGMSIGTTVLYVTEVSSGLSVSTVIEVTENPGYLYGYLQAYIAEQVPMEVWGRLPIANVANYDFMTDLYDLTIYAAEYYDGTVYACGMHTVDGKYYLMKISPNNFFYNIIDQADLMIRDFAFDYTTGTMYAVAYNDTVKGGLYQMDLDTLQLTLVSDNDLGLQLITLACDDEGTLYTTDTYGEVFTMDKDDAEIWSTGIYGRVSPYLQAMTYDYNNDAIYWAVGGGIYRLDLENKTTVLIGDTGCAISGLFSVPRKAPAVPETVDPAGVAMAEKNTVAVGDTLAIEAVVLPVSVAVVDQTLTWKSSNETIAVVDENGVVTGISAGEVYITATDAKGNSNSILITVTAERRFFYGYDELSRSWVKFGLDGQILQTWADDATLSPIVAAQYINGTLYAYDQDGYFYTIDTETFERTWMGNGISGMTTSLEAWDKTHDEQVYFVDGIPYVMIDLDYSIIESRGRTVTTLYGVMMAWSVSLWRDSYSYKFVELDLETGAITEILAEDELVDGMSLRPTNLLYRNDLLYTINGYITGMITTVDPVFGDVEGQAICPDYWGDFNGGRSMIEDPLTGTVYAIRDMRTEYIGSENYSGAYSTSVLCTMELGIGRVDQICTIGSNMRIVGLFIM